MDHKGTYQKGRRKITQPVTHIAAKDVPAAHREVDAVVPRNHDPSNSVVLVNRATGWTLAILFIALLISIAYVGTTFFTREHQIENMANHQRHMRSTLDTVKAKNQELERRIVELETQLENLED